MGHCGGTLLSDTLVRHSCGTLFQGTLVGHSYQTLFKGTLVRHWRALVGHSFGALLLDPFFMARLWDTPVGHSCKALLCDTLLWGALLGHLCGTLFQGTLVGQSRGKLLWLLPNHVGHSCRPFCVCWSCHRQVKKPWVATVGAA